MEAPICAQRRSGASAVSCRFAPFPQLRIRHYREETDLHQVQELERSCANNPNPNPSPNPTPSPNLNFCTEPSPRSNSITNLKPSNPISNSNPTKNPTPIPNPIPSPNPTDLFLLATSALGDPLARVCTYPRFCMMVAEANCEPGKALGGRDRVSCDVKRTEGRDGATRIVGVVRAGVKEVVRRDRRGNLDSSTDDRGEKKKKNGDDDDDGDRYVTLAYISGLRVAHRYRRLGVAQRLMREVEAWCEMNGATYCYLATDNENEASVSLFTQKLSYTKFLTPSILVQPVVYKHDNVGDRRQRRVVDCVGIRTNRGRGCGARVRILKIDASQAEALYRDEMGRKEFFPRDINAILRSPLNAGTWLAYYARNNNRCGHKSPKKKNKKKKQGGDGDEEEDFLSMLRGDGSLTSTWAMLSLWRYDKLIRFEMKGPAARCPAPATKMKSKRLANKVSPSGEHMHMGFNIDTSTEGFGVQLVYGVHVAGHDWQELLERLWWEAHNFAMCEGSRALVVEMGEEDPIRSSLPHLSEHHDLWCLKRLGTPSNSYTAPHEWASSPPRHSFFLDPRDF